MTFRSINPTNGKVIQEYQEMPDSEVRHIIDSAHTAFQEWQNTSFARRSHLMMEVGDLLTANARKYAELMAEEMGKPVASGITEVEKCAWCCEFYANHAEQFLQPEIITTAATKSYVTFQPLGVVLAIMPWNFPFWQVFRFAIPALMAGNVGLLKHASNVTGCALAIEDIFDTIDFPKNVFRTLVLNNKVIDETIRDEKIVAVSLTGSTKAGKTVASIAGSCVKKCVLELGGSDPYIILEDADLDHAVDLCVSSRLTNSGQSCIAAKRFIVIESIREEFEKRFVERMQVPKIGDPLNEDTEIGPQARLDLRDNLHAQVQKSIEAGAVCLLGGELPQGPGAFYPPTVLTNVKKGMPAYHEELFGPVASIISASDENEAIHIANDSLYGLGGAVFTRNLEKGEKIAALKIQSGSCFVNAQVKSDPRLPFGGIKESGFGRELSHYGIKEFVNIKTVLIA